MKILPTKLPLITEQDPQAAKTFPRSANRQLRNRMSSFLWPKVNICVINILFACERRQYDEQAGEEEKNNRQLAQFRFAFPLGTENRARIHD
jgi:hypothetical protein